MITNDSSVDARELLINFRNESCACACACEYEGAVGPPSHCLVAISKWTSKKSRAALTLDQPSKKCSLGRRQTLSERELCTLALCDSEFD